MSLAFELVPAVNDDARQLILELETELSTYFSAEQRHGYSVERLFQPHIRFYLVRLEGAAVACGGFALEEEGRAELKRMYVRPAQRGCGIGSALIRHLEAEAKACGVRQLVLETGDVLAPALRLYERSGFTRCLPFGEYLQLPSDSIRRSVFLEKSLT